jgi:hypothetical protein
MAEAGALQVIQSQQNLVGSSVAGGTAAIKNESSVGILEQIRDITLKSFRKTSEIASSLVKALDFDKQIERRKRDDAVELSKESGGSGNPKALDGLDDKKEPKGKGKFDSIKKSIGGIGAILSGSFIGKLFSPLISLFGKGGFLFRFLGPLGPIGLIIGGVMLLFKYSDEIIKSLTPAIDKIKKLWAENQPLIDALKNGFDWLFKNIIGGLGRIIGGIIDDIGPIFSGFSKLLQGDIMGGLKDIGVGLLNIVLFIPRAIARFFEPVLVDIENWFKSIPEKIMNGIKSIGTSIANFFTVTIPNTIKNFINGIIDSLPLPDFVKNKLKINTGAGETSVSTTSTTQKMEGKGVPSMLSQELPKTINVDQPRGASKKETSVENLVERRNKLLMQGPSRTGDSAQRAYEDELKMRNAVIIEAKGRPEEHRQKNIIDPSLYAVLDMQNKLSDLFPDFYEQPTFKFGTVPSETGTVAGNQELMSPDDEMNKFMTPKRTQASGLVTQGGTGSITVINNSPTSVISQNDVKKTDVISGSISTSSGDNYFDRTAGTYAA